MDTPSFSTTSSPAISSSSVVTPPKSHRGKPPLHQVLLQLSPDQTRSSEPSAFLRVALFFLSVGQLVLLATLLAALGFLFHFVKTSSGGTSHPGSSSGLVELSSLSSVPLEQLQNMHSLLMKWPEQTEEDKQKDGKRKDDKPQEDKQEATATTSSGTGREYLFHVLSAVRDKDATTLNLSQQR
eukprot:GHVS01085585.1.p1 GENE.GHVS01085585.1~~GHVS01085585.1.p1  ORF type:complete len:183 (-),score=64.03 GHVS01085585.1:791-1339(-)